MTRDTTRRQTNDAGLDDGDDGDDWDFRSPQQISHITPIPTADLCMSFAINVIWLPTAKHDTCRGLWAQNVFLFGNRWQWYLSEIFFNVP